MNARVLGALLWVPLVIVCLAQPGRAEPPDEVKALRDEVEALKGNQRAMREDLEQIKSLLRRLTAGGDEPQDVVLGVAGHRSRGARDAALTLVEFSDFQCPFCGRYFRETLPQIDREYVQTGKIRYVFRNFPLESIHKEAFKAAEAADCAGEQDKYWEMHDRLFAHQDALGPEDLSGHAAVLGLDVPGFEQCLQSGRYADAIRQDVAEGEKAGVRGTPSFFLGVAESDGKSVRALKKVTGAHPFATFKEAIEGLLAARGN